MAVKTADKSLAHLFPPFRAKAQRVLLETGHATGEDWVAVETYRAPERQSWLYASGRTREGPVITWLRSPQFHGAGLAFDAMPKRSGYKAPRLHWETYRKIYRHYGLDNPAWGKGDLGHCQCSDPKLRARALVWVRAGFKDPPPDPPPAGALSVMVDGEPVPDAAPYLAEGRAWVMLRPVTDGLDLVIAEVRGKGTNREALLVNDEGEWTVDVVLKEGRAFVRAFDLPARTYWWAREKIVTIDRKPKE